MLESRANPQVSDYRGLHFGRGHFHRYDCWECEQDICALRTRARYCPNATEYGDNLPANPRFRGAAPTSSKFVWLNTRLC